MILQKNIDNYITKKSKSPEYYHEDTNKVYGVHKETLYELILEDEDSEYYILEKESFNSQIWKYKKI